MGKSVGEHDEVGGRFEPPYEELETLRDETSSFIGRRILFWSVRWTIGFIIIWAIVSFYPDLSWLWWVGICVAALSLALLLIGEWWLKHTIGKTRSRVRDLEAAIAEAEKKDNGNDHVNS